MGLRIWRDLSIGFPLGPAEAHWVSAVPACSNNSNQTIVVLVTVVLIAIRLPVAFLRATGVCPVRMGQSDCQRAANSSLKLEHGQGSRICLMLSLNRGPQYVLQGLQRGHYARKCPLFSPPLPLLQAINRWQMLVYKCLSTEAVSTITYFSDASCCFLMAFGTSLSQSPSPEPANPHRSRSHSRATRPKGCLRVFDLSP